MGLLDGDLKEVFGSVFAPLLLDATLTKWTLLPDGEGGMTRTSETSACKGMVEKFTSYERSIANIPSTDVKLIVLQKDVSLVPDLDSELTIRGQNYSIQMIDQDPAQASWTFQGRPIFDTLLDQLVLISAPIQTIVGTGGTPRLSLVVNNVAVEVIVDAVAPPAGSTIAVDAPIGVITDTGGEPTRTVHPAGPAETITGIGGAPVVTVFPVGPAEVIVDASGIPEVAGTIEIDAPIGVILDAASPVTVTVRPTGAAEAVLGVSGAPTVTVHPEGAAGAIVGASGAPRVTVTASGAAEAVVDATGAAQRTVRPFGAADVITDANGAPTRTVRPTGPAEAVVGTGATPTRVVSASGPAEAVVDAGGVPDVATPTLWTPADAASVTVTTWFDASDAATITKDGSDLVSAWADKSGNSNTASQATGSRQPLYVASNSDFGGFPTISPIDAGDGMSLVEAVSVATWLVNGQSAPTYGIGIAEIYAILPAFPVNGIFAAIYPAAPITDANSIHYRDGVLQSNALDGAGTDPTTAGGMFFAGRIKSDGLGSIYGRLFDSTGAIMNTTGWDRTANKDFAELLAFEGSITLADRQRFEGYFAHKYNRTSALDGAHPYKTDPPYV